MAPSRDNSLVPRRGHVSSVMDDLANRIEQHIVGKARGRVRDLHVICAEGLIILQGRARTQHDKQVVQEAVFDVADHQARLANRIVVSC